MKQLSGPYACRRRLPPLASARCANTPAYLPPTAPWQALCALPTSLAAVALPRWRHWRDVQSGCSNDTINMRSRCDQAAINLQSTCNHALIKMQSTPVGVPDETAGKWPVEVAATLALSVSCHHLAIHTVSNILLLCVMPPSRHSYQTNERAI